MLRLTVSVLKEIHLIANYTLLPIHIQKSQMQLRVLAVASTANCHQTRVFFCLYGRFIDFVSKLKSQRRCGISPSVCLRILNCLKTHRLSPLSLITRSINEKYATCARVKSWWRWRWSDVSFVAFFRFLSFPWNVEDEWKLALPKPAFIDTVSYRDCAN